MNRRLWESYSRSVRIGEDKTKQRNKETKTVRRKNVLPHVYKCSVADTLSLCDWENIWNTKLYAVL
jgi:hypothetical protein